MVKENNIKNTNILHLCSVGQKIPANAKELAEDFLEVVSKMAPGKSVVGNMDETPLWFDMPHTSTIDFKGVKTVKAKTTGHEKLRYLFYSNIQI